MMITKIKNLFSSTPEKESDNFWSSPFYNPEATPEEEVHNVFLYMGFSDGSNGSYHLDNELAYNYASVGKDSVYLNMRAKNAAFNDSGTIGPPLPNAQELIDFICYESLFEDDEYIIQKNLRAFLGPIKGLK